MNKFLKVMASRVGVIKNHKVTSPVPIKLRLLGLAFLFCYSSTNIDIFSYDSDDNVSVTI